MQCDRTSVAALLILAASVTVAWADDETDASPSTDATSMLQEDNPEVIYIDPANFLPESLGRVVTEPLDEVPLREAVAMIGELTGMPCRIVEHQFNRDRVNSDILVSLKLGLPLYMALDCMCWEAIQPGGHGGIRIAWVIDRGILSFTTDKAEHDWMQNQAYDIGYLLVKFDHDAQRLIDVLQAHTPGAMWMNIDGIGGEVNLVGNVLMVRQSFSTHRKIQALLAAMRCEADTIYVDNPPQTTAIHEALLQSIHGSLNGVALNNVLRTLSDQTGVDIQFDPAWKLYEYATAEAPVEYAIADQSLRTTLELICEHVDGEFLDYSIRHQTIWVSLDSRQAAHSETILYRVDDVTNINDIQELIDLVQSHVSGEWMNIDGFGGEIDMLPGNYLVVTQAHRRHAEIADLLVQLRHELQPLDPPDPDELVTRSYSMSELMATDLSDILPKLIAIDSWKDPDAPDSSGAGEAFVIRQDEMITWLVVKQTRSVHAAIVEFIHEAFPNVYLRGYPAGTACYGFSSLSPEE